MTRVLPLCFALRGEMTWSNPGAFVSGGQSVFNSEPLTRRTDGGGGWMAALRGTALNTPGRQKTWNAITTLINLGDDKLIVPFPGFRLKPGFAGSLADTPWSDDTPFDDDSLFASGSGYGTLNADVALRATEMQVVLPADGSLEGGEPFSLTGPTYGTRLYMVAAVTDVTGLVATITFGPPAREAYTAGLEVDFEQPRCTMRAVIDQSEGAYPVFGRSKFASASMTFVETWT
jgi:hypothetical protein